MDIPVIRKALVEYVSVLAESAGHTRYAGDRPSCEKHLAESALMFVALEKDTSLEKLKELVKSERHHYGWGFLQGKTGDNAESAFDRFASLVESI